MKKYRKGTRNTQNAPGRTSRSSKRAKIEALLCLQDNEMRDVAKIARAVGTSIGYVRNIEYDIRSDGGMKRAEKRRNEKESFAQRWARWRRNNPEKYAAQEARARAKKVDDTFAHHNHRRYTKTESEEILIGAEEDDAALAKKLGRTIRAIQGKRYYLREAGMQISP